MNVLARVVADRTSDAYARDRYSDASWRACCALLLRRGYSEREVEQIMRSRWPRAAADLSGKAPGKVTSRDFAKYLEDSPW